MTSKPLNVVQQAMSSLSVQLQDDNEDVLQLYLSEQHASHPGELPRLHRLLQLIHQRDRSVLSCIEDYLDILASLVLQKSAIIVEWRTRETGGASSDLYFVMRSLLFTHP